MTGAVLLRRQPPPLNAPGASPVLLGLAPGARQIIRARQVIISGPGGGEFIYDAAFKLRVAQVGTVTTDPVQGITCQAGISTFNAFGAVLFLQSIANDATFFYNDTASATQGTRILSIASASGTDPVIGTGYPAGQQGIDPAFADFVTLVGANIDLGLLVYTRNAKISVGAGSGATRPKMQLDAPEQGTSGHLQMQMAGASPDATKVGQLLIGQAATAGTLAPTSLAMVEVQGQAAGNPDAAVKVIPGGSNLAYAIAAAADANNRWLADLNGKLRWGNGTAFGDTTLERAAAGILLLTSVLELPGVATPAAPPAGNAELFSDTNGLLRMLAGLAGDTNVYSLGQAKAQATHTTNINSLSDINLTDLTLPVGLGTYRLVAKITGVNGGVAATQAVGLSGTGGLAVNNTDIGVKIYSATNNTFKIFGRLTALATRVSTGSLAIGETFTAEYEGILNVTTAGSLTLTGSCVTSAADPWTSQLNSYMRIEPYI